MDFLEWATSPWGQSVPIHIAWFLIWVAVIAGLLFFIVHATYVRYFAKTKEFAGNVPPAAATGIPEHVPRHSLTARLFHWIMAASMFTLLFTAFLPRVGVQFPWVTYHWIAGVVLTASVIFHIIHASFFATRGEERCGLRGGPSPHRTNSPNILWRTSSTTAPSWPPGCLQS
jgi:hypothetical protein